MPLAQIYVLDPGAVKYGDCILCNVGGKWILVDAGQSTSDRTSASTVLGEAITHRPLQDQIRAIRGSMHVDLLILTHCHSDHLGCLPALLADHDLTFDWALTADRKLGFGLDADEDLPPPDALSDVQKLRLALREEPLLDASDPEILAFIADAAGEYERYRELDETLGQRLGARHVVYRGPSDQESPGLAALQAAFGDAALRILGPSQEQLLFCAASVAADAAAVPDAVADAEGNLADAYRALTRVAAADVEADDVDGRNGAAVNSQSIVFALGADGKNFLFTGDLQFARSSLGGDVDAEIDDLLRAIANNGPYYFAKLSHHGATNGQNEDLMRGWGARRMVISTGSKSGQHPTSATLNALRSLRPTFQWARTDINGVCTYELSSAGRSKLTVERNQLNDTTLPADRADTPDLEGTLEKAVAAVERSSRDEVEVVVRLPYRRGRVTVTIDVEPGAEPASRVGGGPASPLG
jgi:beta-lactamase superfamily II metal-dependent hydrolase